MRNYKIILLFILLISVTASGAMAFTLPDRYTIMYNTTTDGKFVFQPKNDTVINSTTQIVVNGSNTNQIYNTSKLTIFSIVNSTEYSSNSHRIVARRSGNNGFLLSLVNRTIAGHIGNSTSLVTCSNATGNGLLANNTWSDVSLTFNGTFIYLYNNNSLAQGCAGYGINHPANINLTIGKDATGAYWNGSIKEVRMFNRSLNIFQIGVLRNESSKFNNNGLRIPTVYYHRIGESPDTYNTNITEFSSEMAFLYQQGFTTITIDQYLAWRNNGTELPPKPIILMFDDGYTSINNASAIMSSYNFKGNINVIYDFVGTDTFLTVAQLKNYSNNGWGILSHSDNHTQANETNNYIAYFNDSKTEIQNLLNVTVKGFVFPFNWFNSTYLTECLKYYDYCSGNRTNAYDTSAKYLYKNSNISNGDAYRIATDNTTSINNYMNAVDIENGEILFYRFDESYGNITYDYSIYHNNGIGTIQWFNDNVSIPSLSYGINLTFSNLNNSLLFASNMTVLSQESATSSNIYAMNNKTIYVLDSFNVTESVSRQYSPIAFTATSPSLKTLHSNLTDTIQALIILNTTIVPGYNVNVYMNGVAQEKTIGTDTVTINSNIQPGDNTILVISDGQVPMFLDPNTTWWSRAIYVLGLLSIVLFISIPIYLIWSYIKYKTKLSELVFNLIIMLISMFILAIVYKMFL